MKLKWIVSIAFWIILLLSIGLSERHRWVGLLWFGLLLILVLATIINFAVNLVRHHGDKQIFAVSHHGYPRWFIHFACDLDEQAKRQKSAADASKSLGRLDE